jgi:hypothetical protein
MNFDSLPLELIIKVFEFNTVSLDVSSNLLFSYKYINKNIYNIISKHQYYINNKYKQKYKSVFCKMYLNTSSGYYNLFDYNDEITKEYVEIKFIKSNNINIINIDFFYSSCYSNFINGKNIIPKRIDEIKIYSFKHPYYFKIKNYYYYYFEFDINDINISVYILEINDKKNIYSEVGSQIFDLLIVNRPTLFCNASIKYKLISEESYINLFSFLT